MILAGLLSSSAKARLRPLYHAVRRPVTLAQNLAWFYVAHRKPGTRSDQRRLWENRCEEDFAAIQEVERDPYYRRLDAMMIERLGQMEGEVMLEIGSHFGYRLQKFARAFPQRRCIGLDLGYANMAFGRRRLAQAPNTALVNADAAALPFADNSIDVLYTCVALTHVGYDIIGKVMAEIGRVVRSGVLLWEVDHRPMSLGRKLGIVNWDYGHLHPYEKLGGAQLAPLSVTPVSDETGHPRYTLFQFAKAS